MVERHQNEEVAAVVPSFVTHCEVVQSMQRCSGVVTKLPVQCTVPHVQMVVCAPMFSNGRVLLPNFT